MGSLEQEIALIIEDENLTQIHPNEAPALKEEFTKLLRKINKARKALSMDWAEVDSRGRVTIPQDYRLLLGIESGNELEVHINDLKNPRHLILRKSF